MALRPRRLFAVGPGGSRNPQTFQQTIACITDLKYSSFECILICFRRLAHPRDLANKLQCCGRYFTASGRGLALSQYLDASAHDLSFASSAAGGERRSLPKVNGVVALSQLYNFLRIFRGPHRLFLNQRKQLGKKALVIGTRRMGEHARGRVCVVCK